MLWAWYAKEEVENIGNHNGKYYPERRNWIFREWSAIKYWLGRNYFEGRPSWSGITDEQKMAFLNLCLQGKQRRGEQPTQGAVGARQRGLSLDDKSATPRATCFPKVVKTE